MLINKNIHVGNKIHFFLEQKGYKPSHLATICNFAKQNAYSLINKPDVSSKHIISICNYLEITPNELFEVKDTATNVNKMAAELMESYKNQITFLKENNEQLKKNNKLLEDKVKEISKTSGKTC
ncbi:MAG: hypothetical protein EOL88_10520 [Bacteroidia bacterium]|nr:helix-turn-helix domain-containing protein [Bacteroidales bacterium]NCD42514.1 hypothetical protein [Bacteroidia bacterium]MDD3010700.1 helix-turn-helix domain-containing protein [Bacteroidales bacterium]MDD3962671.1 helix-turn-helix domain-containing protein [Bacteroidales bacterium]MDY0285140.1 helix-turn-helix domain-containing protein [Bacteroidales bacterium]